MSHKLLTILLVLFFLVSQSFSQYLAYESFDYPMGSSLDTLVGSAGNGWAGPWDHFDLNDSVMVISDSTIVYDDLDYAVPHAGLQATGGNVAAWGGQRYGRQLDKTWPDENGNVYWISFLIELSNNFSDNGWAGLGLFLKDTSYHEIRLIGHEWGNPNYCLAQYTEGTYSDYAWDSGPQWLVVKMIMSGDTLPEQAYMWVSPDPAGGEPEENSADVSGSFAINDGFNVISMHFGNENVGARMSVDEIRLGTNWNDVSSEISTALDGQKIYGPAKLKLSQNYPNPFNPTTKINYVVEAAGKIRLSVFDLAGREVAVLVNDIRAPGEYSIDFSASNLTSGIYFYQLLSANGSITKKMTLVK
jgi:Secretion system C-terminal sorting domain